MDIVFKKNVPIFPVKVTHAIITPLHLQDSADRFMQNLLNKKVIERVKPGDPPEAQRVKMDLNKMSLPEQTNVQTITFKT